jgi:hypothetical protein
MNQLTTGRNADAGLTFVRHSGINITLNIILQETPSAAVYGRASLAGCKKPFLPLESVF